MQPSLETMLTARRMLSTVSCMDHTLGFLFAAALRFDLNPDGYREVARTAHFSLVPKGPIPYTREAQAARRARR